MLFTFDLMRKAFLLNPGSTPRPKKLASTIKLDYFFVCGGGGGGGGHDIHC